MDSPGILCATLGPSLVPNSISGVKHHEKQGDCLGSSAFLIVDLIFHGQWPSQVGRQPPCTVVSLSWTKSWLILFGLEASHFRSCNDKIKVPKRWSSTLCMLFPFWPSFLRQRHLNRYGLFCAKGFDRRRYLFSTTHEAPLIFGGNSNSHRWSDNSLRVTSAVCKGAVADWTRPVPIPYQVYFVLRPPVCCSCALAISHNYLVSRRTERSQWDLFPMIWKRLKEARTPMFKKRS